MNEELSGELETAVEMLEELYDSLNEIFSAVNDYIKELSKKLKEYFNSFGKNDNSAHLAYAIPASKVNTIWNKASYMAEFTRWLIALNLILSFHLKIPPINRLQWGGV